MIIEPKMRGFICTTAHPEGCAANVQEQITWVGTQEKINKGPKNALIIGCSTGYGLASRIIATMGCNANTIGVMFEKPADEKRTASAGWYNTVAFIEADDKKHITKTINGDAFSQAIKEKTFELIKNEMPEGVDLIIYSLAAPRRVMPDGTIYQSVLKPIGSAYQEKNLNLHTGDINQVSLEPASIEEINDTIKVMGGEDWLEWITQLAERKLLAQGVKTVAYSYIGPELTYAMYRSGTIGKAKEHLEKTSTVIQSLLNPLKGNAYISVNKALVTQASAAIPVVPLYAAILYRVMKEKHIHENCIQQIYRLFKNYLYPDLPVRLNEEHIIRLDDYELREDVQAEIKNRWSLINRENVEHLSDIVGYRQEFYQLFGFNVANVDYQRDTPHQLTTPDII